MLLQLCYASKAQLHDHVWREQLNSILTESWDRNDRLGVCGVLYFADNCFFQCLQGSSDDVLNLFHKIKHDPRHENVAILHSQPIQQLTFDRWHMKYVGKNSLIKQFFFEMGFQGFQPTALDQKGLGHFIQLLHQINPEHSSPLH